MGLFDSLLSSVSSGQNSAIGHMLLSLLASESGCASTSDEKAGTQSPAAVSSGLSELVRTGMAKGELLPLIAQMLPTIVDRLTPNQHVPDEGEISRMQSNQPIET